MHRAAAADHRARVLLRGEGEAQLPEFAGLLQDELHLQVSRRWGLGDEGARPGEPLRLLSWPSSCFLGFYRAAVWGREAKGRAGSGACWPETDLDPRPQVLPELVRRF